jgi:hypothetical protein
VRLASASSARRTGWPRICECLHPRPERLAGAVPAERELA